MKIYAARDKDGRLWFYFGKKPCKGIDGWYNQTDGDFCKANENLASVKWEDEEPKEVIFDEITHKMKVK